MNGIGGGIEPGGGGGGPALPGGGPLQPGGGGGGGPRCDVVLGIGIFAGRGGSGMGHICCVIDMPGWMTDSHSIGRIISPDGPMRS